jgi:hypothetical protein
LLGATHVKVYASGRVDGAFGEDGLDGERCVVINRIPQLLLREAALAIMRAQQGPPGTRPGEALLGHVGAPMAGGPSFAYPPPTVAAINGHAYAGGLITALGCDYRVASEGALQFSLNEVPIGLPMPAVYCEIIKHAVGPRAASGPTTR